MKQMIAVPDNTPSCSIYLLFMGLLGHIAVCPSDLKNVKDIISNNLVLDSQQENTPFQIQKNIWSLHGNLIDGVHIVRIKLQLGY